MDVRPASEENLGHAAVHHIFISFIGVKITNTTEKIDGFHKHLFYSLLNR